MHVVEACGGCGVSVPAATSCTPQQHLRSSIVYMHTSVTRSLACRLLGPNGAGKTTSINMVRCWALRVVQIVQVRSVLKQ